MGRILLVDDEENNLKAMQRLLRSETPHEAEGFTSAAAALERAREATFEVVVADYRMPGMDGASFLEQFQQLQPHTYRIIASAYADGELFRKAINQAHIHRFIQKPWDGFLLVEAVTRGAEQAAMSKELVALKETVKRLTGLLATAGEKCPGALPANWREGLPE